MSKELIDRQELLTHAEHASKYDPEMMVIGVGYVHSARSFRLFENCNNISNLEGVFKCDVCNFVIAKFGINFCPNCGRKINK